MTIGPGTISVRIDGEDVPVRLTLGALAEIEDLLKADSLMDLARLLANPSATQVLGILAVLLRAAGRERTVEQLGTADLHLGEVLRAMAALFRDLMGGDLPGKPNPAVPGGAPG